MRVVSEVRDVSDVLVLSDVRVDVLVADVDVVSVAEAAVRGVAPGTAVPATLAQPASSAIATSPAPIRTRRPADIADSPHHVGIDSRSGSVLLTRDCLPNTRRHSLQC